MEWNYLLKKSGWYVQTEDWKLTEEDWPFCNDDWKLISPGNNKYNKARTVKNEP